MALRKGFPAKLSGVGADADDMRYNLAGMVVRNTDGTPRSGLFPPVSDTLLSATATMNISVAAFEGVVERDGGVVFLANDGPQNVLLDAAPGSNSRLDVIFAKQDDSSSTVTTPDADNLSVIGVLKGIASSTPERNPAGLPEGALELGTALLPSTAVNTSSSGVVITPTFQFAAMNGGVVDFRTKTDLDLWTTSKAGQRAFVIATGVEYVRIGSVWKAWSSDWISYTTTLTGLSSTGGTTVAKYKYVSGRLCVKYSFTLGSSPSVNAPTFTLPVTFAFDVPRFAWIDGRASAYDLSTTTSYELTQRTNATDAGSVALSTYNGTVGTISSTAPFTWSAGDIIAGTLWGDAA